MTLKFKDFPNKRAARTFCLGLGYIEDGVGESGDGGHGSRLYFKWPDGPLNQFGAPLDTCNASKVPGCPWRVAYEPKETV